jgi:hypothetical protein
MTYMTEERGIQKEGLPVQIQCQAPVLPARHSRDRVLLPETMMTVSLFTARSGRGIVPGTQRRSLQKYGRGW